MLTYKPYGFINYGNMENLFFYSLDSSLCFYNKLNIKGKSFKILIESGEYSVWPFFKLINSSLSDVSNKYINLLVSLPSDKSLILSEFYIKSYFLNSLIAHKFNKKSKKTPVLLNLLLNSRFSVYLKELYPIRVRKIIKKIKSSFTILSSPYLNRRKSTRSQYSRSLYFNQKKVFTKPFLFNRLHGLYSGRLRKFQKKIKINYRARLKKRKNFMFYYFSLQKPCLYTLTDPSVSFFDSLKITKDLSNGQEVFKNFYFPFSIISLIGKKTNLLMKSFYGSFSLQGWFVFSFPLFYASFLFRILFLKHMVLKPHNKLDFFSSLISKCFVGYKDTYSANRPNNNLQMDNDGTDYSFILFSCFLLFSPMNFLYSHYFSLILDYASPEIKRNLFSVSISLIYPMISLLFNFSMFRDSCNSKEQLARKYEDFEFKNARIPSYFYQLFLKQFCKGNKLYDKKFLLYMKVILHFYTMRLGLELRKVKKLNSLYVLFHGSLSNVKARIQWEVELRKKRSGRIKKRPRKFIIRRYYNMFHHFLPRYIFLDRNNF